MHEKKTNPKDSTRNGDGRQEAMAGLCGVIWFRLTYSTKKEKGWREMSIAAGALKKLEKGARDG